MTAKHSFFMIYLFFVQKTFNRERVVNDFDQHSDMFKLFHITFICKGFELFLFALVGTFLLKNMKF